MIDPEEGALRLSYLKRNYMYKALFGEHKAYLEDWIRHRGDKLDLYTEAKNNWDRAKKESDRGKKRQAPEEMKNYKAAFRAWKDAEKASLAGPIFWHRAGSLQYLGIEGFSQAPFSVKGNDGKPVLNAEEALAFIDPDKSIDWIERLKRNYVLSRIFGRDGIEVLPREEKFDPSCDRVRRALRVDRPADTGCLHFALATLDDAIKVAHQAIEAAHQGEEEISTTILDDIQKSRETLAEAIAEMEKLPEPDHPRFGIQPYERILLEDTRKGRGQLLKEYTAHLDKDLGDPRKQSRRRRKAEELLEVWDMREKKISIEEIAEKQAIPISTAEDRYLQARGLTQGPQEVVDVLQKLCGTCADRDTEVCKSCHVQKELLEKQKAERRAKRVRTGGTQPGQLKTEDEGRDTDNEGREQVQAHIRDHFIADSDTLSDAPHSWHPEGRDWKLKPERTDKKKVVLRKANPTK